MARIQATNERTKAALVSVAVCWLNRVDDEVAAGMSDVDLEDSAVAFIDGSDWRKDAKSC